MIDLVVAGQRWSLNELPIDPLRLGTLLRGWALRPGESIKVVLRNATRRRRRPRVVLTCRVVEPDGSSI